MSGLVALAGLSITNLALCWITRSNMDGGKDRRTFAVISIVWQVLLGLGFLVEVGGIMAAVQG